MRTFIDIERQLDLIEFNGSSNGSLFVPRAVDAPLLIIRKFDRALPPSLIPVYASLLAGAAAWIAADRGLADLVSIEQPEELGEDFLARRYLVASSLDAFLETDPDEDPPEPPDELAVMQARFADVSRKAGTPREQLLATILGRSLLERTGKTFFDFGAERFIVGDLKPTRDELETWDRLERDHDHDHDHDPRNEDR